MLPMKMILLSVLFFATSIYGQTKNDDFLDKPHVLPSAERAYHAIYHELDSKMSSGARSSPMFGQLYVALIEDQFTFGGDLDEWPASLFKDNNKGCKPFMGANVHHMCNDAYFLVHQDMVKLQKTVFQKSTDGKDPDLAEVCGDGPAAGFSNAVKAKLLYRYSHRIPMTYKASQNDEKCFGTYDTRTDTFTCMKKVEGQPKLVPYELQNFLWSEDDGKFARGNGNVEVFCKQLHYK